MMKLAIFPDRIFTGNDHQPLAEALIIENDRIVAVGSAADIKAQSDKQTRNLSLPGRLITPGLVDGHCHFVNQGVLLQRVDLRGVTSLEGCRQKIHRAVQLAAPGEWVVGRGWDHHRWTDGKEPTRLDLDDLAPNNPVVMTRVCGHSIWVNSMALSIAGITCSFPDHPGGKIERDPITQTPTGIIRESISVVTRYIPLLTPENYRSAALAAQKEALSYGITSVHSCEGLREWTVLSELEKENQLKIRVYHLLHPEDLEAADVSHLHPENKRDHLWFDRIKLYADGSLGSGTALLHEPYEDDPENFGLPFLTLEQLQEDIERAYSRNFDVAIHAIGDKAVTHSLWAIKNARNKYPGNHRDRIEHIQLFRTEDLKLFKCLNITASVQPIFLPSDREMATQKWGHHRCKNAYAWKTLQRAGILLQLGSDSPVEPINPLLGIKAELERTKLSGQKDTPWIHHEGLTLSECIVGFTRQAAWTSRRESDLGIIAPGKLADLTVFDQDLFQVPVEKLSSVKVDMTIIGGEIVYQKDH